MLFINCLNGDAITIKDAKENSVNLDGEGNIVIDCSDSIEMKCGDSKISLKKDGTITITGKNIEINASTKGELKSTVGKVTVEDVKATLSGVNTEVKGDAQMKVGGAMIEINGTGIVDIKGGLIKKNG